MSLSQMYFACSVIFRTERMTVSHKRVRREFIEVRFFAFHDPDSITQ